MSKKKITHWYDEAYKNLRCTGCGCGVTICTCKISKKEEEIRFEKRKKMIELERSLKS